MTVEQVRAFIEPAIARSGGQTTFDRLAAEILAGQKQLFATPRAAAITYLWEYPTGQKVLHVEYAGGDLQELLDNQGDLIDFARREGASKITLFGRKGWRKVLPEWRETGVIMERGV